VQNGHSSQRSFTSLSLSLLCLSPAKTITASVPARGLRSSAATSKSDSGVRFVCFDVNEGERESKKPVVWCVPRTGLRSWKLPASSSGARQEREREPTLPHTNTQPPTHHPFVRSRTLIKPNWITRTHTHTHTHTPTTKTEQKLRVLSAY
jgi:hypothetical protein